MLFLMVFGSFPEKFSLGIFFSPSKPNTIRLIINILILSERESTLDVRICFVLFHKVGPSAKEVNEQ